MGTGQRQEMQLNPVLQIGPENCMVSGNQCQQREKKPWYRQEFDLF
jgi:hypothetical protein